MAEISSGKEILPLIISCGSNYPAGQTRTTIGFLVNCNGRLTSSLTYSQRIFATHLWTQRNTAEPITCGKGE